MIYRTEPQFENPAFADAWLRSARERAALECRLLGSILRSPLVGIALADAAGVDAAWFEEEDYQTVYLAVVVKRSLRLLTGDTEADRSAVLRLARDAIGHTWTDANLVELFCSEFTHLFIPRLAELLSALRARQREATAHVRYAWEILAAKEGTAA